MKRTLLSALIAAPIVAFAGAASADGLTTPQVAQSVTPVATSFGTQGRDWTGFYVGGSLGYADVDIDGTDGDFEGAVFGGHVGYNYDLGNIVIGAELEAVGANDVTQDNGSLELDSILRAKVRAGYDAGQFLPYITAGVAQAEFSGGGVDLEDDGPFYGVGVDYAYTDEITIGAEYLRHDFDDFDGGQDIEVDTFSLRVSYNF